MVKHQTGVMQAFDAALLAALLSELMEMPLEAVDLRSSPAELGLDSLAAAELHEHIERRTGITVPIEQILSAIALQDILNYSAAVEGVEHALVIGSEPLLGATQEALYFQQKISGSSPAFHLSVCFRLQNQWPAETIQEAVALLLQRHPELTASFSEDDRGQPVKRYRQDPAERYCEFKRVDSLEYEQLQQPLQSAVDSQLDISRDPLFRLVAYSGADAATVFLFVAHHLVIDLWSFSIAVRDFLTLLSGREDVNNEQQPELFSASIKRQQAVLESQRESLQSFWRQQLCDLPRRLEFDRQPARSGLSSARAECAYFEINRKLTARLSGVAKSLGVNMNSILLGLYGLTLARFSGQADVLIGVPVTGRRSAAASNTVGCFINTVVLPLRTRADQPLDEYLRGVHQAVIDAYAHQDLPLHQAANWLDTESVPGISGNMVQNIFILQRTHKLPGAEALVFGQSQRPIKLCGHELTPLPVTASETPFDIGLMMVETEQRLSGEFKFRPGVVSRRMVDAMSGYLLGLAGQLADDPAATSARLESTDSPPISEWLMAGQSKPIDYPGPAGIAERVLQQARRHPDRIAVGADGDYLSYAALVAQARDLAARLINDGVQPEQRVVVLAGRSPETLVAMLGTWLAGAVYVPIDAAVPGERQAEIVRSCRPVRILATGQRQSQLQDEWKSISMPIVDASQTGSLAAPPTVTADGQSLAYIIYTSGSEGVPKGVMATHSGAINFALSQAARIGLEDSHRLLQVASFGFDASMSDVLMTLLTGAILIIANPSERVPGAEFMNIMRDQRINLLTTAASLLESVERPDFDALKMVISTAEACTESIVTKWGGRYTLYNGYGPTEASVGTTIARVSREQSEQFRSPAIGRPFDGCQVYLLDSEMRLVPPGVRGEIYISGAGVARGYFHSPGKTAGVFLPDPFTGRPGQRMYRTGDYARQNDAGEFEFLGRRDQQINIRGHRIELAEVERALHAVSGVAKAVVSDRPGASGERELVAWAQPDADAALRPEQLRRQLSKCLPEYMLPATIQVIQIPLNANGKADRQRLLSDLAASESRQKPLSDSVQPDTALDEIEQVVAAIWSEVLGREVSRDQNFFDAGGHSLALAKIQTLIAARLGHQLSMTELFQHHTVSMLARRLASETDSLQPAENDSATTHDRSRDVTQAIAIIGIGCRFPGAEGPDAFWQNLRNGHCAVEFFSDQALLEAGLPAAIVQRDDYVAARAPLDDPFAFDIECFDCSEREAELLDPQRRVLLECAYAALAQAGYGPLSQRDAEIIGAYLSASGNSYYEHCIRGDNRLRQLHGDMRLSLASDKSFLATHIAYKLKLGGPAVTVDTACSSSLVAVHQACQSIRNGECDVALAGGISIDVPVPGGHVFEPSGIGSRDGYCRAFDAGSTGTVKGMGGGVLVLKALSRAQRDGDDIYAVIHGSAVNNDAGHSAGFTAPSVAGQTRVIQSALKAAGIPPEHIDFLEAHGTGTPLGDPIEMAALREVFTASRAAPLVVGSVKSNIGHLDAAAGVAGLIKTALALHHSEVPATLHVNAPNPALELEGSSLTLATVAQALLVKDRPCYAGVSSFGMGGTNCHMVLGQAERVTHSAASGPPSQAMPVLLGAHSQGALQHQCAQLADHIEMHPGQSLADIAYTLATHTVEHVFRKSLVATGHDDLTGQLRQAAKSSRHQPEQRPEKLVFVFPGQAGQHAGLADSLYRHEQVFREVLDESLDQLDHDCRRVCREWLLCSRPADKSQQTLTTRYLQPALFCYELALCRYLQAFNVQPDALLGHSVGELVAAVVAGTLSTAAGASLVQQRGQIMQQAPPGAMLVAGVSAGQVRSYLSADLDIALYNSDEECVVSGPRASIERLQNKLSSENLAVVRVATEHAFHHHSLDDLVPQLAQAAGALDYAEPQIPWISNTTGTWVTRQQAMDSEYWADQMRQPVQLNRGIANVLDDDAGIVIIGAGGGLARTIRHNAAYRQQPIFSAGSGKPEQGDDLVAALRCLGTIWEHGFAPDWSGYFNRLQSTPRRLLLPACGFDRQQYCLKATASSQNGVIEDGKSAELEQPPSSAQSLSHGSDSAAITTTGQPPDARAEWLRDIWQDLLGVAEVQPDTDFFDAGGDSLMILRLCGLLSEQQQLKLTPPQLIAASRFGDMAELIANTEAGDVDRVPEVLLDAVQGIPLSFQQQRMWFQHGLEEQPSILNLPISLALDRPKDHGRIVQAFQQLVRRHPALCTRLHQQDGVIRQYFDREPDAFRVTWIKSDAASVDEQIRRLADTEFDLKRDWLIRVGIVDSGSAVLHLVVVCHHIICDGLSLTLLLQDWLALYKGDAKDSDAADALSRFSRYVHDQHNRIKNGDFESQLDYWSKQLAGAAETPLPGATGCSENALGRTLEIKFPDRFASHLQRFCAQYRLTPHVVMLAVWKCLIARQTGSNDICLGAPVSERLTPGLTGVAGLFVNTVVLRTQLSEDESFLQACRQVADTVSEALAHGQVPFDVVVDRLLPQRTDRTSTPFFRAAFVMESGEQQAVSGHLGIRPVNKSHAQFELALWLRHSPGRLNARLEYRTEGFDDACMQRLADIFPRLAQQMLDSPDSPWRSVHDQSEAVDDAKNKQQLSVLTGPAPIDAAADGPDAGASDLAGLLKQSARRHASRPALLYAGQVLSYLQMEQRATVIAAHLRARGVSAGDVVGIYLPRCLELPLAMLAAWKCGAVIVPLETELPAARLLKMLADSAPQLVITLAGLRRQKLAAQPEITWLELDRLSNVPLAGTGFGPATALDSDIPAYIIYTSGSTGEPKGVMNAQRGLINRLQWMNQHYRFGVDERFLHKTPISFDVSLWEIFCPLLCGGSVVIAEPGQHRDPRALAATITRDQINVVHFVPSMLRAYLAVAGENKPARQPGYVFCSGEGLPDAVLKKARMYFGDTVRIINLYGPTEASIEVSHWEYTGQCDTRIAPIGIPIAGVGLYVLDEHLQAVAYGETGQLFIAGECVVLGYHQRPGTSAECFLPDPYCGIPGRRMYRSGDLARINANGDIEFLGRADDQFKLHGFRIEPGDVEAALLAAGGVRDAVVVCVDQPDGEPRLIAYVVLDTSAKKTGDRLESDHLRDWLTQELPAYMVPAVIMPVNELPISASGKLDRAALPAPEAIHAEPQPERGLLMGMQQQIGEIWRQTLGVSQPHSRSDFFAAGGNSIAAISLADRIEAATGRQCPIRLIFSNPVLQDMAAALEQSSPVIETVTLPQLVSEPQQADKPFVLTDLQNAYWVGRSRAFEMGNIATHGYLELDVQALDRQALRAAVNALIRRHDALRLVVDDQGRQRVLPQVPDVIIEGADLRGLTDTERSQRLAALREQLAHAVYNPESWPLFEFYVVTLDDKLSRVLISIDALLVDGWSIQLLQQDLNELYARAVRTGSDLSVVEPTPLRLRDYVRSVRALRDSDIYHRDRDYWRGKIPALPPAPPLPLARDPRSIEQPGFVRLSTPLGRRCSERLRELAAQHNASMSVLLLTAYAQILASWSNATSFSLNLTISDRVPIHPQVGQLVGNLSSLLILHVDLSDAGSFADSLHRVRDGLLQDMQHRHYGGVQVLRHLAASRNDRTAAQMPVVFTSLVDVQSEAGDEQAYFDFSRPHYAITQTSQAWLDCNVAWSDDELVVSWDAVSSLFADGMLAYFHQQYTDLLMRLADTPESWHCVPVPLLRDRQPLLWRAMARAADTLGDGRLLYEPFLDNARQYPDSIAVQTAGRELSYSELARMANVLAQRLVQHGAERNVPVAVLMDNGWQQVVSVLAVVMAGTAYLPISTNSPRKRWQQLLELGNCRILLVAGQQYSDRLSSPALRVVNVDDELLKGTPQSLNTGVSSRDLAYVIFTSGSSGHPKGVMIDHRGALNTILDINQRFAVGADDAVLALSSFTFDLSVYDVFGLLAAGGRIVFPDAGTERDPAAWAELIQARQITLWNAVPALTEMLVEYQSSASQASLAGLRLFLVSGDWIPVSLPRRARRLSPDAEFISLGGATEASIWSIAYPVSDFDESLASIPYGYALGGQAVLVLDHEWRVCPPGVTGQIVISGAGVARGYWGNAQQTAASFVHHPQTGQYCYLTGDLGRYMPAERASEQASGEPPIEFLGRADNQVKIRGHRIELGEIEHTIARLDEVDQVAVKVHQCDDQPAVLMAYLTAELDGKQDAGSLFERHCGKPLCEWQTLVDAVIAEAQNPRLDVDMSAAQLTETMPVMVRQYEQALYTLFAQLGLMQTAGEPVRPDEVMRRGGFAGRYRRWLLRALNHLADSGYLQRDGDGWRCLKPLPTKADDSLPSVGFDLLDVLTERQPSAELYLSDTAIAGYQTLFAQCHSLMCSAMETLVAARGDEPLQVLEVGAGHGSCTRHVLPLLPSDTQYVFTDISPYFLNTARENFAAYPFVDYAIFNLDNHPQLQGLPPHSFDVIIAASVLHDIRDIRVGLRALFGLLKPGGTLLMIEETRFFPFFDLGMGLQQGFDGFADTGLRSEQPLLSRQQWCHLLTSAGFAHSEAINRERSASDMIGFDVIMARMPEALHAFAAERVKQHLNEWLPAYMVPAHILRLQQMPLTANGKLDRKALPDLPGTTRQRNLDYEPPQNPRERQLTDIWQDVLNQPVVGVKDNFFELGGDSLLAVQLVTRIRSASQCELPVRAIFEAPTIRELGYLLDLSAGKPQDQAGLPDAEGKADTETSDELVRGRL